MGQGRQGGMVIGLRSLAAMNLCRATRFSVGLLLLSSLL